MYQQPQLSWQPQPQLPPQLLLMQELPLPPQITTMTTRMISHHQPLPKAQKPELLQELQDIKETSQNFLSASPLIPCYAGAGKGCGFVEKLNEQIIQRDEPVSHAFPFGQQLVEDFCIGS